MKKLENKIFGQTAGTAYVDRLINQANKQESICDQLYSVAKSYNDYINDAGKSYPRFIELYNMSKDLLVQLENAYEGTESAKAELVLSYEEDLLKYLQNIKLMAEKSEHVLNIEEWPDLSSFQEKLEKLKKLVAVQKEQSDVMDNELWERIIVYKKNLDAIHNLEDTWNKRLEEYENADKEPEEDE